MAFSIATLKILIECASEAHHTALYVVRVGVSKDLCVCFVTLLSLRAKTSCVEHVYSGSLACVPHVRTAAWSILGSVLCYDTFGVVMLRR
jgi:hypothetical protein